MPDEQTIIAPDPEYNKQDIGLIVRDKAGHTAIERLPFINTGYIDNFLASLKEPPDGTPLDPHGTFTQVESDPQLKFLLEPYAYCDAFDDSFMSFTIGVDDIKARTVNHPGTAQEKVLWLYNELWHRRRAHKLHVAYQKAQERIAAGDAVLYTHRRRGWKTPAYNATDALTVHLKTNFAYGTASYFFLRLSFHGLLIVPYSTWIEYPIVGAFETVDYWRKYAVENASWNQALRDCCDAINLCVSDTSAFLEKYVIAELESMVAGMESLLSESTRYVEQHELRIFVDEVGESPGIRPDGITRRGAKIVGALKFIAGINRFQQYVDVAPFTTRIAACNQAFRTAMQRELRAIDDEIVIATNDLQALRTDNEGLRASYPVHTGIVDTFSAYVHKWSDDLLTEVQGYLPDFAIIAPRYTSLAEAMASKERHLKSLQDLHAKATEFIDTVTAFFDAASPTVTAEQPGSP